MVVAWRAHRSNPDRERITLPAEPALTTALLWLPIVGAFVWWLA